MRKHITFILLLQCCSLLLFAKKDNCKSYQKILQQENQFWHTQNINLLETIYAKDVRWIYNEMELEGIEAVKAHFLQQFVENENLAMSFHESICGESGITSFWTMTGFNKVAGIPFKLHGTMFLHIKKGKIVMVRGQSDRLSAFLEGGYTLKPLNNKMSVTAKKQLVDQFSNAHTTRNTPTLDKLLTPNFTRITAGDIEKGIAANKDLAAKKPL